MRVLRCWTMAGLALAAFVCGVSRASAASSYDSCVGFIDVVPAVISTPGNWCLRQHLRTNLTSTNAIEVQSNNVTIDCNGFMLDNQAAGPGTYSAGVSARGVSNITVRNCTIEGFYYGTFISSAESAGVRGPLGSGHIVENSRFSQNRYAGVHVDGFGSVIRGNIVTNTGSGVGGVGIVAWAPVDVIDNVVDGVFGDADAPKWDNVGLLAGALELTTSTGFQVRGNRVRNVGQKGSDFLPQGLKVTGYGAMVRDNLIGQRDPTTGYGLLCFGQVRIADNIIKNYNQALYGKCDDQGGNIAY